MGEVLGDILWYGRQMVPMGLGALVLFLALRPGRRRRLAERGLVSGPAREGALCLFVLFCAGLAALTLFPARFWLYVVTLGRACPPGVTPLSFYPAWGDILGELARLPDILAPLQEIKRALRVGSYWLWFMLVGNIAMFVPMGFFPALLWRGWRWWRALLLGAGASCAIEFVQFFIGRSTDIDDVILNTTGAMLGFWLFCLLRAAAPGLAAQFLCNEREDAHHG